MTLGHCMARLCEAFSWKREKPGSAKACLQETGRQPRMGQPWRRPKARLHPLKPEPVLPLGGLERRGGSRLRQEPRRGSKKAADRWSLNNNGGSITGTWPPRCCARAGRQPLPMRDKSETWRAKAEGLISAIQGHCRLGSSWSPSCAAQDRAVALDECSV